VKEASRLRASSVWPRATSRSCAKARNRLAGWKGRGRRKSLAREAFPLAVVFLHAGRLRVWIPAKSSRQVCAAEPKENRKGRAESQQPRQGLASQHPKGRQAAGVLRELGDFQGLQGDFKSKSLAHLIRRREMEQRALGPGSCHVAAHAHFARRHRVPGSSRPLSTRPSQRLAGRGLRGAQWAVSRST